MMRRMALVLTVSLIPALAGADRGLIPLTPEQGGERQGTTILRGARTLTLYQRPDTQPLRLSINARRIGRYEDPIVAAWPADADPPLRSVSIEAGQTGELVLPDCPPGPVQVRLDTGQNAASVSCNGPLAIPAAADGQDGPASFISSVGRLYFFVPRGTEQFTVHARGQGVEENVHLTVFTPQGEEAGAATSIGSQGLDLRITVPARYAGAVWSLTAGGADTGVFEDCHISLGREVPQYLSLRPDGLLVPFVTGLRQPPRYVGSGARPTVRFELSRAVEAGTLSARVEGAAGEPISVDASDGAIEVPIPPACRAVTVALEAPDLPPLSVTTPIARRGVMLFVGGYEPTVAAEPIAAPDGGETGVRISQALQNPPPGLQVIATLRRSEPSHAPGSAAAEVIQTERAADWDGGPVQFTPDAAPGDGAWEWLIVLRDADGALLDWSRTGFVIWDDAFFADHTPPPPRHLPAEMQGPWLAFRPAAADAIPYRHRPPAEDVARDVVVTRGEYESLTIGVLALDETRNVRVEPPTLLSAAGEQIPAEAWEVRWARYWPQRTGWRATAYQVIPEMLERRASVDLAGLEMGQAWLTLRVPDDARPGRYAGYARVTDAREHSQRLQIRMTVQPFELMEPTEHHWGLYTDSTRWRSMSERRVRAEMRDFVAHGITSAMMYPPYHAEFSMEGERVRIDSREFERYMRWALEEGLRPPTVISMQALGSRVKELVPDAEPRGEKFEGVYKQIVQHFADLGGREGWGELVWHAVDEPNRGNEDRIQAAYQELSWFKDLGLSTFTTVNDPLVAEERLDPVLDARCYYASYVGRSAEAQEEIAAETVDSGDRLWLYGTGCYIGMDGTTMPNRWLAGYMLRKTEAEGIWCWTLQRAKGDIYNDFDGAENREAKEACTTYVSEDGSEMVPTLQWEGHREGVDDFRYIYTLQKLAAEHGERGQEALAELDALLAEVPWGLRPGDFSAADSDALRADVAALVRELLE